MYRAIIQRLAIEPEEAFLERRLGLAFVYLGIAVAD